jgi:hypothetical protein
MNITTRQEIPRQPSRPGIPEESSPRSSAPAPELINPSPNSLDGAEPPPTIHLDGYRVDDPIVSAGVMSISVRLVIEGKPAADVSVWSAPDTDEARGYAERLLPVITAICRFLNTAACPPGIDDLAEILYIIGSLPAWWLQGVTYLAQKVGGIDVVYTVPGRDETLRIVEGQFAEFLDTEDLDRWREEYTAEGADGDGEDGPSQDLIYAWQALHRAEDRRADAADKGEDDG